MATIKQERIAGIIKKNLSEIIQNQLKDKNVGFVTITDVEVTNELSFAKIYVTFLDKSEMRLEALKKAKGYLKTELSKKMSTYKVPDLLFQLDESLNQGNRITEIIDNLKMD